MNAQALRDVRRSVAGAADAQMLQVLRMVDSLEVRGATDELLAPVRPRLRAIQPARPLRFARLLFLPVDALIVAPAAWRPNTPFVPRNALLVLANAVRETMQDHDTQQPGGAGRLACVDALTAGATTAQTALVRQAGALLWPGAAAILRNLGSAPPASLLAAWSAQSLPQAELARLSVALGGILRAALALHDHDHSGIKLSGEDLTNLLAETEKLGPNAWGMMLGLLAIRVPQNSAALFLAAQKVPVRRKLAEAATETALAWLETETAAQVESLPPNAAAELRHQASLLDTLADQLSDTAQRRRLGAARASLLSGSLNRFEIALQTRLAAPLQTLPESGPARDAALDAVEEAARILRAFELEARRFGAGPKFDSLVQSVRGGLRDVAGLSRMDLARLTEILAGPEAAARVLAGEA